MVFYGQHEDGGSYYPSAGSMLDDFFGPKMGPFPTKKPSNNLGSEAAVHQMKVSRSVRAGKWCPKNLWISDRLQQVANQLS